MKQEYRNMYKKYSFNTKPYDIISSSNKIDNYDVSFAIPSYQRTQLFIRLLQSIEKLETCLKYQVVITEDTRDMNHIECIKKFLTTVSFDYIYIYNKDRLGLYPNWNQAISLCQSKYFILLHTDDILNPLFLKAYENYFEKGFDAICQKWHYLYPMERINSIEDFMAKKNENIEINKVSVVDMFRGFVYPLLGALIKKDVLDKIGWFPCDEEWSTAEDYIFMTKLVSFVNLYQISANYYGYIIEDNCMLTCDGWQKSIVDCYFLRIACIKNNRFGIFKRMFLKLFSHLKVCFEMDDRIKWMKDQSKSKEIINKKEVFKQTRTSILIRMLAFPLMKVRIIRRNEKR